jgi:single-strand DNA-binding protein
LATNERWIKDGNKTEITEWHNIVMWKNLAEIAEKYVRKGKLLYIEGKIRSRSYDDKDGIKRYITEILADTMQLVGSKPDGAQQSATSQTASAPSIETTDLETATGDLPF